MLLHWQQEHELGQILTIVDVPAACCTIAWSTVAISALSAPQGYPKQTDTCCDHRGDAERRCGSGQDISEHCVMERWLNCWPLPLVGLRNDVLLSELRAIDAAMLLFELPFCSSLESGRARVESLRGRRESLGEVSHPADQPSLGPLGGLEREWFDRHRVTNLLD